MNFNISRTFGLAVLVAIGACSDDFDPASKIDSFRLLAIQANPPEISKTQPTAQFTSLVVDSEHLSNPHRQSTVLYFVCLPNPNNPLSNVCTKFEAMRDPVALVSGAMDNTSQCNSEIKDGDSESDEFNGISFVGIEACDSAGCRDASVQLDNSTSVVSLPKPEFTIPSDLKFDGFPSSSLLRYSGIQVVILAFAIDAAPEELISGSDYCQAMAQLPNRLKELQQNRTIVDSLKRIIIRGPDATDPPNENPILAGIRTRDANAPTTFSAKQEIEFLAQLPAEIDQNQLFQPYNRILEDGQSVELLHEEWSYSWFTTSGKFKDEITLSNPENANKWTAPDGSASYPLPPSGHIRIFMVARDSRGGTAWTMHEMNTMQ